MFAGCAPDSQSLTFKRTAPPDAAFVIEWKGVYYVFEGLQQIPGGVAGIDKNGRQHYFFGDVRVIVDPTKVEKVVEEY